MNQSKSIHPLRRFACIFLSFVIALHGEDLYFTQSGSGSQNGTIGNPWSLANANNSANWGSGAGKVSAGDTLHVVGTITGAFTGQGSGTLGNRITLLFDSGAKFSSAALSGNYITWNASYITIDGGASGVIGGLNGNPLLANGVIENTNNGTGLANQVVTRAIRFTGGAFNEVKNLVISNIYVRTAGTDATNGTTGISSDDNSGSGVGSFTVYNCIIHDVQNGIFLEFSAAGADHSVSFVTGYNNNWGVGCADHNSSSVLTSIVTHDNYFYNFTNWDGTDSTTQNLFHHNGIYVYTASSGSRGLWTAYNNFIGPGYSNVTPNGSTSGLFASGGNTQNTLLYNNIFISTANDGPSNGYIDFFPDGAATGTMKAYNNTFIGAGTGAGGAAIGVYMALNGAGTGSGITYDIKNNVFSGIATAISRFSSGSTTLIANYNDGYSLKTGENYNDSTTTSSNFKTFAQWQALGYDAQGTNGNPNLSGSYVPTPTSAAIGAGFDLSGTFTTDFNGATRTVPWDMGAVKAAGSGSTGGSSLSGKISITGKAMIK